MRLCGKLFPRHNPRMSAPLSRKNLPESPTPDDILNAFLDYLTNTSMGSMSMGSVPNNRH